MTRVISYRAFWNCCSIVAIGLFGLAACGQVVQRPILHLSVEGAGDARRFVTVGTFSDGRQAGTYDAWGATWSPTGQWFAYFSDAGLEMRNLQGEIRTLVTPVDALVTWKPAWAPDGKRIAFLSLGRDATSSDDNFYLDIVDVMWGSVAHYPIPSQTLAQYPFFILPPDKFRWSPDGENILISWGNVIVVNAESGEVRTISQLPAVAEWAPASDAVYFLSFGDTSRGRRTWIGLFMRRLEATEPSLLADADHLLTLGLVEPHGINYGLLSLSPDGSMLAIAAGSSSNASGTLRVYDTRPGSKLNLAQPLHAFDTGVVTAVDWAPDEKSLATISIQSGNIRVPLSGKSVDMVVQIVPLDGGAQRTIGSFKVLADPAELDMLCFKTLSWMQ